MPECTENFRLIVHRLQDLSGQLMRVHCETDSEVD